MKKSLIIASLMLLSASVFAKDIEIVGVIHQPVEVNSGTTAHFRSSNRTSLPKTVTLLKVALSSKIEQAIKNKLTAVASTPYATTDTTLPSQVQLGMNNVPVMDQGQNGTCVTFAVTAAIDAGLNKGDYISQLCQLQLGQYLQTNGYMSSGWDGSTADVVLNQMSMFGIINKQKQRLNGCGGLTEYPIDGLPAITTPLMHPEDFHALSEELSPDQFGFSTIMDSYEMALDNPNLYKKIDTIKQALNAGDRVTIGVLLAQDPVNPGVAGAVGTFHAKNDSWVLTPEIMTGEAGIVGGHEMLITGYNDDAMIADAHGNLYRGAFTLRNSWGAQVGDKGDFYMSYYYFKVFADEIHRIRIIKD